VGDFLPVRVTKSRNDRKDVSGGKHADTTNSNARHGGQNVLREGRKAGERSFRKNHEGGDKEDGVVHAAVQGSWRNRRSTVKRNAGRLENAVKDSEPTRG